MAGLENLPGRIVPDMEEHRLVQRDELGRVWWQNQGVGGYLINQVREIRLSEYPQLRQAAQAIAVPVDLSINPADEADPICTVGLYVVSEQVKKYFQ